MSQGFDTWRLPTVPILTWLLAMGLALGIDAYPVRSASQQVGGEAPLQSLPVGEEITREQAVLRLQQRYGNEARVVRTDVMEEAGHHVFVFRMLSVNGRIWIVHIDARSGAEVP